MSQPLLNDSFWEETASAELHPQTVLQRIRRDLSEGRPDPISVNEVFKIAQTEMGYHPNLLIFAEGEIASPLWVIGAVWGYKCHGMSLAKARSFGCFLGTAAGGDQPGGLGGGADKLEKQAREILQRHLGRKLELNWAETDKLLDEVITCYQKS